MKREINFSAIPLFISPRKTSAGLICWSCVVLLSSCFQHYYKTNSSDNIDAATLQNLIQAGKYFVLHANHTAFAFTNLKVNEQSLEGDLAELKQVHAKNLNPTGPDHNWFLGKDKDTVLFEVHLYGSLHNTSFCHVVIPFKEFTRLDTYALDKVHTTRSTIGSIAGTVLITAGVIAIISAIVEINSLEF